MEIKLEDFEGKYLVLVFYPQDFTFICPTEVIAFGNRASEFEKINCSIVACSTDSLACHRGKERLPSPFLSLGCSKTTLCQSCIIRSWLLF
jgi:peroxiredoxin (alkyl hydroperoxide reductase subunit C)